MNDIKKKLQYYKHQGYKVPSMNMIKSEAQIEAIRASGKINTALLDEIKDYVKAGVTTLELDTFIYERTLAYGAIPAPLHYEGFPNSCCISINEEVCHGIPSKDRILQDDDIVNIDVSTIYNGYFSDSSRMFCVGEVSEAKSRLVSIAWECIEAALKEVRPYALLGNVGAAVYEHATQNGYSVVCEIGGHGVGLEFHEEPWVGFVTKRNTGMLLVPGMIFTIEPMINMGKPDIYQDMKNGWTIYTRDQQPSAQWEVMVLVTASGYEILAK